MRKIMGLVLGCLALASCGSSSNGSGSTCEQVGRAICAKACSCRDGAACALSQGDSSGSFSTDFSSEADCLALYVTFGCSAGDKAYNDAAACLPMIQAATCTGTGADGALSFPKDPACDSPP